MIKSKIGNPSGLRFTDKNCGICGSKDEVIQFERESKRKGLKIIEIAFLCYSCAEENDLIKDSKLLKEGAK